MTIKKTVHRKDLPPIHPGLQQRLREAELAEQLGQTPRQLPEAQKIIRPSLDAATRDRVEQVRTVGLVEPVYRVTQDGLRVLAEQEPFLPGQDLDQLWDTLSEADKLRAGAVERFRLEMETHLKHAGLPCAPPHLLGGRLDARNLKRSRDNLLAQVDAFGHLLAADAQRLLRRFIQESIELLDVSLKTRAVSGLDVVEMDGILQDWVNKLIYQELINRRRSLGERGIRRICANVDLAENLYKNWRPNGNTFLRDRLLLRLIFVHMYLGHTAYAARVSYRGSKLHRTYGLRMFVDDINRYRMLFEPQELETAKLALSEAHELSLPLENQRIVAFVQAIEHLGAYAPHRVWQQLAQLPGVEDYLEDLQTRAQKSDISRYVAAKTAFRAFLGQSSLPVVLQEDILAAMRPFEKEAPYIELPWVGVAQEFFVRVAQPPTLELTIADDLFLTRFQTLFDCQQELLARVLKQQNITATSQKPWRLGVAGQSLLSLLPA